MGYRAGFFLIIYFLSVYKLLYVENEKKNTALTNFIMLLNEHERYYCNELYI